MGTGKFTREWNGEFFVATGWGWGIFHRDGIGMGKIFMGMGTILFTISLSSLECILHKPQPFMTANAQRQCNECTERNYHRM